MKTINSIQELKQYETAVYDELNKYVGSTISTEYFKEGTLMNVNYIMPADDLYNACITADFSGTIRTLYFKESKAVISDTFKNLLTDLGIARSDYLKRFSEKLASKYAIKKAEQDALRAELKQKADEKKKQARIKKVMSNYRALKNTDCDLKLNTNFYTMLGWLAKNTGSIHATVPEYLEDAFLKDFGKDAPHLLVDSSKKTSGGYDMQFTFSFKMTVKDAENAPISIATKLSGKQSINDTAFIYMLCDEYGFKFGKEQDYDTILANIPEQYQAEFNVGYGKI